MPYSALLMALVLLRGIDLAASAVPEAFALPDTHVLGWFLTLGNALPNRLPRVLTGGIIALVFAD
jgi:hypothetical protein